MPTKDQKTQEAIDSLKNPNFSPNVANADQPLVSDSDVPGPDFTNATNDINKSGRVKLGQYLSDTTKKNIYSISTASDQSPIDGRLHARGNSLTPMQSQQESFAGNVKDGTLDYSGLGVKNAKSTTGENRQVTFFTKDQIDAVLSKTAANENLLGGNLLSTVPREGILELPQDQSEAEQPGLKILREIQEQLKEANMYTSNEGMPFIRNVGGTSEEEVTRGLFTVQRTLGFFDPNAQPVTKSDMLVMASAIMARAAGDSDVADSILRDGDPEYSKSFVEMLAGIINVTANAGVPIDNSTLQIGENLIPGLDPRAGAGQNAFLKSLRGTEGGNNVESATQMNYSSTQFESSMFLMTVQSMLLLVGLAFAMELIIIGIGKLVSVLKGELTAEEKKKHFGQRKSESLQSSLVDILVGYLGVSLPDTKANFHDAFIKGLPQAIGLSGITIEDFTDIVSSLTRLLEVYGELISAQGYYATFFRSILKSGNDIIAATAAIGKITSFGDGPGAVLGAINSITGSKLWSFVVHCANLGDIILSAVSENNGGMSAIAFPKNDAAGNELISEMYPRSTISDDGTEFSLENSWNSFRNQHTRWGVNQKGGSYSWAVGQPMATSLHTFVASQKFLPNVISPTDLSPIPGIRDFAPSPENVEMIENMIESEYMPFYMHDLRTSEVISMPAFITEFGETFVPKYNDYKGVGRQDAVKIYGGTDRQVTFGFMLVSYSKEDHDVMWWNINKLIAMCYPQYSKGRIRDNGSQKFIQPFSQVQAASPLIRLRLGDVFKSNYSKFGLARLFGVNSDVVDNKDKNSTLAQLQIDKQKAMTSERAKIRKNFENAKANFGLVGPGLSSFSQGDKIILSIPTYVQAEDQSDRVFTDPYIASVVNSPVGSDPKRIFFTIADAEGVEGDDTLYSADLNAVLDYAPGEYLTKINSSDAVKNLNNQIKDLKKNFPNNSLFEENSIVRSFESTRGRGVAGVITNLGLDYGMGNYPWSIDPGSKAPMIVKISLGFAPITDLPLGLDYDGNIRNPSHPVGKLGGSFGDVYSDIAENETGQSVPSSYRGNISNRGEFETTMKNNLGIAEE